MLLSERPATSSDLLIFYLAVKSLEKREKIEPLSEGEGEALIGLIGLRLQIEHLCEHRRAEEAALFPGAGGVAN